MVCATNVLLIVLCISAFSAYSVPCVCAVIPEGIEETFSVAVVMCRRHVRKNLREKAISLHLHGEMVLQEWYTLEEAATEEEFWLLVAAFETKYPLVSDSFSFRIRSVSYHTFAARGICGECVDPA